ncbi:MAG: MFS transporter [Gluconacetobacter diazotrophicus]|nr:MFS transporter [Gluconacetobacter diazotrophicus]
MKASTRPPTATDPGTDLRAGNAPVLGNGAVGLLAVAAAIAVANGYYIQPLLLDVSRSLAIPRGLVGILPALSQIGLACGLAFLLPLGDIVSARRLLSWVIPVQVAALILFAASRSAVSVAAAALLIGVFGITPYVLPPHVSRHVPAARLGHVTAVLTRGVIVGILLARAASGAIGTHLGWRATYWIAAALMAAELVFLFRVIGPGPATPPARRVRYPELIASLPHLLRTVPELRAAASCQALAFGSFNVFWLGATLTLQAPPFGWTPQAVGLVAVVGAIAASVAPRFGRVIDRIGPRATRRAALAGMAAAWVLLAISAGHLAGMAVGLVVLDVAAAVVDISNRTILYGLDDGIRTRLNAVYQVAMFSGGAVMSVLVGVCWAGGGWLALCALGLMPVLVAFNRCRGVER